jgi:hypothetical protein
MEKAKLKAKFEAVPLFNEYIRELPMLALISPDHINAAFAFLKDRANEFTGQGYEKLEEFLRYFEAVRCSIHDYERIRDQFSIFRPGSAR